MKFILKPRALVLKFFGNSILASQLDEIVTVIEEEFVEEWVPADGRLDLIQFSVPSDEEGGEVPFDANETINAFDDIISILEALRQDLPAGFGHNRGEDFPLSPESIRRTEAGLRDLKMRMSLPEPLSQHEKNDARRLARQVSELGKGVTRHMGAMLSVSTLKFSEKFGEVAGSWSGRAAILLIFGERLLQLVA